MQLWNFIRRAFVPRRPLDARNLSERVRDVSLSVMEDAEIPLCLSLYRANERAHFPPGFFETYEAQLRNGGMLNLIARRHGEPVGCGGLAYGPNGDALFCFGMVAPAHQKRGIGTALFLARLALLIPAGGWSTVRMTAVRGSLAFNRRFGVFFATHTSGTHGVVHPLGILSVSAAEIEACRAVLADRHITYPDVGGSIPRVGLLEQSQGS